MAYNDSNRGKGRPAGTRGGVKKYPLTGTSAVQTGTPAARTASPFRGNRDGADKKPYYGNKANEDRKPYYGNKTNEDRKPYYGNKTNEDRKPYRGNRDNADRKPYAAKGNAGWDRKPRRDRKKEYDRIPPRDTSVKVAGNGGSRRSRRGGSRRRGHTIRPPDWSSGAVPCGSCFAPDAPWTSCWCIAASGRLHCHAGRRGDRAGHPGRGGRQSQAGRDGGLCAASGVIAMVAQKDYCSVEDITALAKERGGSPLIVIADGITDPYNAGAHPLRRGRGLWTDYPPPPCGGTDHLVAKSSAGAMERRLPNSPTSPHGQGAPAGRGAYAAEAGGKPHYETDLTGPCALVFGSEGRRVPRGKTGVRRGDFHPHYGKGELVQRVHRRRRCTVRRHASSTVRGTPGK